jgi:peptidoglycan/xylan/chitin deacetylase (PgdA/CDA1 family)
MGIRYKFRRMTRLILVLSLVCKIVAVALVRSNGWLAAVLFFGPDFYWAYQIFVPSSKGLVRVLTRFETDRREIWLTIDDGPDEKDTPQILDLLESHGARATFFVVGERAARLPELVSEIVRRGNEVGNHTQTHPSGSFWCASPGRVGRELDQCTAVLARAGVRPRWFRAPVGIKNFFLGMALRGRGLACVGWSVRGLDSFSRDPARVAARVLRRIEPGAIVLMHEGPSVDPGVRVEGVRKLLDGLRARDMVCVLPPDGSLV